TVVAAAAEQGVIAAAADQGVIPAAAVDEVGVGIVKDGVGVFGADDCVEDAVQENADPAHRLGGRRVAQVEDDALIADDAAEIERVVTGVAAVEVERSGPRREVADEVEQVAEDGAAGVEGHAEGGAQIDLEGVVAVAGEDVLDVVRGDAVVAA